MKTSTSSQENKRINIFPFTTSFFKKTSYFENYIRETLPDILTVEHTQLRTPDLMVFAYQGDPSLWGYAEIESWKDPSETEAAVGIEWELKHRLLVVEAEDSLIESATKLPAQH